MIPYIFLILLPIGGIILDNLAKEKVPTSIYYYFILLYCILLAGLRYKVGIDTYNYIENYNQVPSFSELRTDDFAVLTYQPLYLVLCSLCKEVSKDFTFFQIVHALIVNSIIFNVIKKYLPEFKYIGITLYIITVYPYFNFEILKESLAVSFGLLAINSYNKSIIKYLLFCFIGFLFHISAIILLLYPLLRKLKFNFTFIIILCFYSLCLFLIKPYIDSFLPEGLLLSKAKIYISEADSGKLNINWIILQLLLFVVVPSLIGYIFRKQLNLMDLSNKLCSYILLGIGVIWLQIIFVRFPNYFVIYVIIAFSSIIKYSLRKRLGVKIWMIGLVSVYILISSYNYLSHGGYIRWIPYVSIFSPKEVPERNILYTNFN